MTRPAAQPVPPRISGRISGRPALPPIPHDVESLDARGVLELVIRTLGSERVAISTAFGPEGIVVLDLLTRIAPRPRVFTIDTGRLPQETHDLMDRVRERFGVEVEVFVPEAAAVEAMVRAGGVNLFYRSREDRIECCRVRKVEPLRRALADLDAWIVGVRRDQISTRAKTLKVANDLEHGMIWKVAPLADWTEGQVWDYVREHDLPYNELHDRGYTSIGCAPCTRPVAPSEDSRSGRWWWEAPDARECGIHLPAAPPERQSA